MSTEGCVIMKKKNDSEKIVMLNFALDTRSTSGKATKAIYQLTSKFGKLKNANLIDLVEASEIIGKAETIKSRINNETTQGDFQRIQKKVGDNNPLSREEKEFLKEYKKVENEVAKEAAKAEIEAEIYISKNLSAIQQAISSADKIVIIGHCGKGQKSLSSDSQVNTSIETLMKILPNNLKNKHIDCVACESVEFGKTLAKELSTQNIKKTNHDYDGMTISSKKHITIPLPSGAKLYFEMRENGLPRIFRQAKDYKTEFLIQNNQVIESKISTNSDKRNFNAIRDHYRASITTSAEVPTMPPLPQAPKAPMTSTSNIAKAMNIAPAMLHKNSFKQTALDDAAHKNVQKQKTDLAPKVEQKALEPKPNEPIQIGTHRKPS